MIYPTANIKMNITFIDMTKKRQAGAGDPGTRTRRRYYPSHCATARESQGLR